MTYCGRCGAPVDGAFCGRCGAPTPQARAAAEPTQPAAVPESQPAPVPPTPPDRGPDRRSNGTRNGLIAAIVVFALVIGAGLFYIVHRDNGRTRVGGPTSEPVTTAVTPGPATSLSTGTEPTPRPSAPSPTDAATPTPGAPSPAPTSEDDARQKLDEWADADERRSPPNDKWQVVLGSKYVGVTDTKQQPQPFTAQDIWRQFQGYRTQFAAEAGTFRVLRSSDYGNQSALHGHTYWVAMLMFNFDSRAAALGWCEDRFHQTGKALEEHCIEAKYTAPHD